MKPLVNIKFSFWLVMSISIVKVQKNILVLYLNGNKSL